MSCTPRYYFLFFFFNDTATTEIYTLSLHDALPICWRARHVEENQKPQVLKRRLGDPTPDRKSTRLNSSHGYISYAVFCLKKKHRIHSKSKSRDLYKEIKYPLIVGNMTATNLMRTHP